MLLDSSTHEMVMWIDNEICRDYPNVNDVLEPCRLFQILCFLGRKKAVQITEDDCGNNVWRITDRMARRMGVADLRLPIRLVNFEEAFTQHDLTAVSKVLKKEFESPKRFNDCVNFAEQTFTAIRTVLAQIN